MRSLSVHGTARESRPSIPRRSMNPHDLAVRDRVRAMAQLVAGILHEFNSPLGALRSSVDTARVALRQLVAAIDADPARAKQIAGQVDEILVLARSATDRIHGTIDTLSHFARIDRADVDVASVEQVIETALRLSGVLGDETTRIVRVYEPGLIARARIREIEHVLYHVLRNAREALDGRTDGVIEITSSRRGPMVQIVVQDNGPGVDPQQLATLFEPSFTVKAQKVGLGISLATCRHIAQEHGGTLLGQNIESGGARFTLRFTDIERLNDDERPSVM